MLVVARLKSVWPIVVLLLGLVAGGRHVSCATYVLKRGLGAGQNLLEICACGLQASLLLRHLKANAPLLRCPCILERRPGLRLMVDLVGIALALDGRIGLCDL